VPAIGPLGADGPFEEHCGLVGPQVEALDDLRDAGVTRPRRDAAVGLAGVLFRDVGDRLVSPRDGVHVEVAGVAGVPVDDVAGLVERRDRALPVVVEVCRDDGQVRVHALGFVDERRGVDAVGREGVTGHETARAEQDQRERDAEEVSERQIADEPGIHRYPERPGTDITLVTRSEALWASRTLGPVPVNPPAEEGLFRVS